MYLFIATIFIAELIIASTIISKIVQADKWVCKFNEKVSLCQPDIHKYALFIKDTVSCAKELVETVRTVIKKKQEEFRLRVIKTLIIYTLLLVMKSRFKKLATFCQYLVFAKDYWDGLLV